MSDRSEVAALEDAVYESMEATVQERLHRGYYSWLGVKQLTLRWSDEMSTEAEVGEDLLVVDQDGNEYVLDIEAFLRKRVVQRMVNADTQDPLPLDYSPQEEGE
jgi:hypothetical protein